jgi:hypothetical protein
MPCSSHSLTVPSAFRPLTKQSALPVWPADSHPQKHGTYSRMSGLCAAKVYAARMTSGARGTMLGTKGSAGKGTLGGWAGEAALVGTIGRLGASAAVAADSTVPSAPGTPPAGSVGYKTTAAITTTAATPPINTHGGLPEGDEAGAAFP